LEKLGIELEWSDEWTTCEHCGKAVRTKADSYRWQQYCVVIDSSIWCGDCIKADPTDYLASLEGQSNSCLTISVDVEEHGYVLLECGFEHGFYGGQDADPRLIAKALTQQGSERFVFDLDSVGQFDLSFSLWVHKEELANLDEGRLHRHRKTDLLYPMALAGHCKMPVQRWLYYPTFRAIPKWRIAMSARELRPSNW
jgi:hypothetical protein